MRCELTGLEKCPIFESRDPANALETATDATNWFHELRLPAGLSFGSSSYWNVEVAEQPTASEISGSAITFRYLFIYDPSFRIGGSTLRDFKALLKFLLY